MSAADRLPEATCVLLRVWLPDRPGALGAVASRIGAVRGDIVSIDVLERRDGVAVDEFGVVLADADHLGLLVREVEEVDGCRVEHVTVVTSFPDPGLDALSSVALVCEADSPAALQRALAGYASTMFDADWAAVMRAGEVLATCGNPPADPYLAGLAGSPGSPPADLAATVLEGAGAIVLVGRTGNGFRDRERAHLVAVARIADRVWRRFDAFQCEIPTPPLVSAP